MNDFTTVVHTSLASSAKIQDQNLVLMVVDPPPRLSEYLHRNHRHQVDQNIYAAPPLFFWPKRSSFNIQYIGPVELRIKRIVSLNQ